MQNGAKKELQVKKEISENLFVTTVELHIRALAECNVLFFTKKQ